MELFNYGWTIDDIKNEIYTWNRTIGDGEYDNSEAVNGIIIEELLLKYERMVNLYEIIEEAQEEYNEIAYELYKAGKEK